LVPAKLFPPKRRLEENPVEEQVDIWSDRRGADSLKDGMPSEREQTRATCCRGQYGPLMGGLCEEPFALLLDCFDLRAGEHGWRHDIAIGGKLFEYGL
jgi:hypothetical protein